MKNRFRRAAAKLDGLPGLVSAFRGVRRRAGLWMPEETLTLHVHRKRGGAQLSRDEIIPRTIDGLATDVIAVGRPRLYAEVDASDLLVAAYDDRERKSAVSALAASSEGGILALGSGHGLLPIANSAYQSGSWSANGGKRVYVFEDADLAQGALWFGELGADKDFGVVRFPDLRPPTALLGHTFAPAPIPYITRPVQLHDIVQHQAARRGYRVTGRVAALPIPGQSVILRSSAGIAVTYENVVTVTGEDVPFSLPGESGSLVFDGQRRAIGLIVGGGKDRDNPKLDVTYVLRDFTALGDGLGDFFTSFFKRNPS